MLLDVDHAPIRSSPLEPVAGPPPRHRLGPRRRVRVGIVKAYTPGRLGPSRRARRRDRPPARRARPRVRPVTAASAVAAVRRRSRPPVDGGVGGDGVALTTLDVLDGLDEIRICTAIACVGARRSPAGPRRRPGRGRAGLRDGRRLAGIDRGRPQLGQPAGPGDQVHPAGRGTDRLPGRFGFD